MQPFKVDVYVSQQDSDDHDESYTYLVFAESRLDATRKAIKAARKDGALEEIGSLKKRKRTGGAPFVLSNEAFRFEYFEEQGSSTAEITEDRDDGLWAQIEVFPAEHAEFWNMPNDEQNTLIKWAVKHRKTWGATLNNRLLGAIASNALSTNDALSEYLLIVTPQVSFDSAGSVIVPPLPLV